MAFCDQDDEPSGSVNVRGFTEVYSYIYKKEEKKKTNEFDYYFNIPFH
jgi:hypothetical protein